MTQLQDLAELAAKYVNTTDKHIFLTGKAGSGKTTFLRYIVQNTYKNAVIAAPTGIAAINAGGVTLHSLLQLPFGIFIPENIPPSESSAPVNTPQTLSRNQRFNASKRKLIQELELLIIDEVSMLRADLLDCIDHTLRFLRKRRYEPFGGLQILFIGDLMQLPPVVKREETVLLQKYYSSAYFFEANALRDDPPVLVELQKVYRQSDQDFIDILNRFRFNRQGREDLERLNQHHRPDFRPEHSSGYIYLTTHNHKADQTNRERLENLKAPAFTYQSHIEGDFPENMYPTGESLKLKAGAQVMFIKNDPTGQGRFFNGKIGVVSSLVQDEVKVRFEDKTEIQVTKYTWENKRYTLNKTSNEIEEKHLGSFEQYPLKLAWAVTIHKSQGLTFEKAILDLSGTFSPGQLYVALSRLTSLDGLVLSSPLPANPPDMDDSLISFTKSFKGSTELTEELQSHRKNFLQSFTRRAFGLAPLLRELTYHEQSFNKDENRSLKQQHHEWTKTLINDTYPLKETGDKFIRQVEKILEEKTYLPQLADRMEKAQAYFDEHLSELTERVSEHHGKMKKEKQVKEYLKELAAIEEKFIHQNKQILKLALLVNRAAENKVLTRKELTNSGVYQKTTAARKAEKKENKTPTAKISYDLYRGGKGVSEIAKERGLVISTIEGHLARYVEQGELEVTELLSEEKLGKITQHYEKGVTGSGEIKSALGDEVSYSEIKLALAHARWFESQKKEQV